jgi:protein-S-isoprenylcysteine O-methyltransferase Ste14
MKQSSKQQVTRILAVLVWGGLTGIRLLQTVQTLQVIPALLAMQSGLVAYQLVFRRRQAVEAPWYQVAVAWVSACLPLALSIKRETLVGQVLGCAGIALALYALWTLGRSFGIAPADRGLVRAGPYRWVRHPMYLGELIALCGAVIGDPTLWNNLVLHSLLITLLLRIRWEEIALFDYGAYAGRVRWRLIPFIY